MNASYEDANKMFDMIDKPPQGEDLLAINYQMSKAMKSAPAKLRILAKEKVSTEEKKEFDAIDTAGKAESDKKTTDLTDDKAINEIWNSGGRLEAKDETDAKAREGLEKGKKKVRKLIGMCLPSCPSNKEGMGFYHDKKSNICYKCKSDCQKCGMYEGECSTCAFGQYEVESSEETEVTDDDGNV